MTSNNKSFSRDYGSKDFNNTYNKEFEKDNLISNLKNQIFEMEQNEKNYNNLLLKYRNLQNELVIS